MENEKQHRQRQHDEGLQLNAEVLEALAELERFLSATTTALPSTGIHCPIFYLIFM